MHQPGPLEDEVRKGRVLVRMPISLHDYLVMRARAESVSLNMFIVSVLAGECGWAKPEGPRGRTTSLKRELEKEMWEDKIALSRRGP